MISVQYGVEENEGGKKEAVTRKTTILNVAC